jgi:hypothetical protein
MQAQTWQSETNLQEWDLPEIEEVLSRIRQLILEYIARTHSLRDKRFQTGWVFRAWANVNQRGHFNRAHDHLGKHSFISGIYYVDIGEIGSQKEAGARTVFKD